MREVVDAVAARAVERWAAWRRLGASGRRVAPPARRPVRRSAGARGPAPVAGSRASVGPVPVSIDTTARRRSRLTEAGVSQGLAINERKPELAAGAGHHGPGVPAAQAHGARPRAGHRVRGGRLPQHLRLLGRRHRHVHAQRRALHPGLRLLPGRHPSPRCPRPRRARAGGRRGGPDGAGLRRVHRGGPRRPARRRGRGVRGVDPGHPPPQPGHVGRGAHLRLQGRPGLVADRVRRPARRAQPQHRDRGPAAAGGATVGRLRPQPERAGPGQGRRAHDEVGADPRAGRDRRRGRGHAGRPGRRRRRHRHHRPVPAAHVEPPARWPAGGRPTSSTASRPVGEALGIGHVESSPLTRSSYHARQAADAAGSVHESGAVSTA